MSSRVFRLSSPPVGLCGELRKSSRVRGVSAALEVGGIEREVPRLAECQRNRDRTVRDGLRRVDREAWVGIDDLIARTEVRRRENRVRDQRLGARRDHHVLGLDVETAKLAHRLGHHAAQLMDAWGRRVAVLAAADGLDRGVLHVGRRREVGLAD